MLKIDSAARVEPHGVYTNKILFKKETGCGDFGDEHAVARWIFELAFWK